MKKLLLAVILAGVLIYFGCGGKSNAITQAFEAHPEEFHKIAREFLNNPYDITQIAAGSEQNYKVEKDYEFIYLFDESKNYYDRSTSNFLYRTYFKTKDEIVSNLTGGTNDSKYKKYIRFLVKNNLGGISKNYYNRLDKGHPIVNFNEKGMLDLGKNGVCYSPRLKLDQLSSNKLAEYLYSSVEPSPVLDWYYFTAP